MTSKFEVLGAEAFEALPNVRTGLRPRSESEETKALTALADGSTLKVPCRWKHNKAAKACYGGSLLLYAAKRHGFRVKTRCFGGFLYVLKLAKESA